MLGILLIYFVGRYFYRLAIEYNKRKWLWAIVGVGSWYAGILVFTIVLLLYAELTGNYELYELEDRVLNLIGIPFSLATSILFYMLLRHLWSKKDNLDTLDEWEV